MDLWVTRGAPKPPLPHVPGCDVAGVVSAVGSAVTTVAVGDEVVVNPGVSSVADIERVGQRQPDGTELHDLRRALLGRPRRDGDRSRAKRSQATGIAQLGGVRRVSSGLPHRLSDVASSAPAVGRHVAGGRHRVGRFVRGVGIGNDDGRPGRGHQPQRGQAGAGVGDGRRRGARQRRARSGRCRPMSWSRASVRRHGSSRCAR